VSRPARFALASPSGTARLAAVLLLATMAMGTGAQFLIGARLVAPGDAAATAANLVAHASLFRLGFALYLVEMSCQVAMTVLLYRLLEPAGRTASLLAASFGLIGCTVKILSRLFFIAPLLVLGGAHYLGAFAPAQLEALALLLLRVNYMAETMAMVFLGLSSLVKAYLVFRSTFLPRALGFLSAAGGLGWLLYLYEPLARRVDGYIVGTALVGALVTALWLLVKGVDEERWREQAGGANGQESCGKLPIPS
jgi:hypothetical protein